MKNFERKIYLSLLAGLFSVLVFETAVGQVELQFSDGTTTDTTFNVDVGTTQTISVIAVDTTGTTLADNGLTTFGFSLNAAANSGTASTLVDFTNDSRFAPAGSVVTPSSASVAGLALLGAVPQASQTLGEFEISVAAPGSTTFTLSDRTGNTDFGSGATDLDGAIFAQIVGFTINAGTAIPEPSGGLLIGFSMLATMIRRRRNRS